MHRGAEDYHAGVNRPMIWYKNIYLGDNAKKEKSIIVARTEAHSFQPDVYLVAIPSNHDNLLEMFAANRLCQPHFRKKEFNKDIYIVGIAKGYDEGLELMGAILMDAYNNTGGFDVAKYLRFGTKL